MEGIRTGIIYGINHRGIIAIPTRYRQKTPLWIHYLIDTGSPSSFLTPEAINALIGPESTCIDEINV